MNGLTVTQLDRVRGFSTDEGVAHLQYIHTVPIEDRFERLFVRNTMYCSADTGGLQLSSRYAVICTVHTHAEGICVTDA